MIGPKLVSLFIVALTSASIYFSWNTPGSSSKRKEGELPAFYWYNEVTQESQWDEPVLEYRSADGRKYYLDPETGESTWDKPKDIAWVEKTDAEGNTYYYNPVSKETTFDKPAVLAWTKVPYDPELADEMGYDGQEYGDGEYFNPDGVEEDGGTCGGDVEDVEDVTEHLEL